jgi:hypothetical protein
LYRLDTKVQRRDKVGIDLRNILFYLLLRKTGNLHIVSQPNLKIH